MWVLQNAQILTRQSLLVLINYFICWSCTHNNSGAYTVHDSVPTISLHQLQTTLPPLPHKSECALRTINSYALLWVSAAAHEWEITHIMPHEFQIMLHIQHSIEKEMVQNLCVLPRAGSRGWGKRVFASPRTPSSAPPPEKGHWGWGQSTAVGPPQHGLNVNEHV